MDPEFGSNATSQFYRTERWLGRLQRIYSGEFQELGSWDEPLDYVLAFFLNCHHIKDWLRCDPKWFDQVNKDVKGKAVEQFVAESEALRICADICNGNKHFTLDQYRSGSVPASRSRRIKIDLTRDTNVRSIELTLKTVRGPTDALELAQECFELWRQFIRNSTPESLNALADRYRGRPIRPCSAP